MWGYQANLSRSRERVRSVCVSSGLPPTNYRPNCEVHSRFTNVSKGLKGRILFTDRSAPTRHGLRQKINTGFQENNDCTTGNPSGHKFPCGLFIFTGHNSNNNNKVLQDNAKYQLLGQSGYCELLWILQILAELWIQNTLVYPRALDRKYSCFY